MQIKRSSTDFLRSIYPEFYRQGAMQSREDWLRLKHKIGRKTGIDPETGRKYREAEPETKWYPPSGAAPTEKGRKAQEAKVGFGAPERKRKKPEPGGGDDQPPGPGMPVSRTAMPRVKVEEQFSPEELQIMRPPQMSEEQRSAYERSILEQRRTGVPTVDPTKGPVTTVLAAQVMDKEPTAKRSKLTPAQVTREYAAGTAKTLSPEELVRRARMQPAPRVPPHLVPTRQPGKWAERPTTVESDLTPARLTKRSMRKTFPMDPPLPKMPNIMQVNTNPPMEQAAKPHVIERQTDMPSNVWKRLRLQSQPLRLRLQSRRLRKPPRNPRHRSRSNSRRPP